MGLASGFAYPVMELLQERRQLNFSSFDFIRRCLRRTLDYCTQQHHGFLQIPKPCIKSLVVYRGFMPLPNTLIKGHWIALWPVGMPCWASVRRFWCSSHISLALRIAPESVFDRACSVYIGVTESHIS